MKSIKENLVQLKKEIPENVTLVAVSKNHPAEMILEAYNAGQKIFGENRVQELLPKHQTLPKDIEWHMIGHLQSKKVKFIAPFIHMIHSVDSTKLLLEINREALKNNRVIPCLLQVYIAKEETKYGFSKEELEVVLSESTTKPLPGISIQGLMGMATFTNDQDQVQKEFESLSKIFSEVKDKYFPGDSTFKHISMGMSGDYKIAIKEGSTIVRIGSSIFGERNYI